MKLHCCISFNILHVRNLIFDMNFQFRKLKSHTQIILVSMEDAVLMQSSVSSKTADQNVSKIGTDSFKYLDIITLSYKLLSYAHACI